MKLTHPYKLGKCSNDTKGKTVWGISDYSQHKQTRKKEENMYIIEWQDDD